MPQSAPLLRTVFRTCVVNAVRESEALMAHLLQATREALANEEAQTRQVAQRDLASDALRLLGQHEAGLVKAYPMALLEIFAEGPADAKARTADPSGMDFGELALVDDAQVQAQVELARAQQQALHTTDATLSELNGLVSAAQGLPRVQPERNPLRPENYIRALQQVVAETGVPAPVRGAWMQHLRALLGPELVGVYQRATQGLRGHGVEPVGYGVAAFAAGGARTAGPSGRGGAYAQDVPPGQGAGYGDGLAGRAPGWADAAMDCAAQEALLTVAILRQMLAGEDPYGVHSVPLASGPQPVGQRAAWALPRGSAAQAALAGQDAVAAAEAMHDIAQLERLVGRLAQGHAEPASNSVSLGAQGAPGLDYGAALGAAEAGAQVVARMLDNLAQDARLLAPVQRAVQNLEPALRQLVRHDPRFFSDSHHPARRLLDELTQRSLAFPAEDAPGFRRFMRLVNEVVGHLAGREITSAAPFDAVLKALHAAWEAQEKKLQQKRQAQKQEQDVLHAGQREMLARQIAAGIRALPGAEQVPADVLDFAAGPWAEVVALAQVGAGAGNGSDPGGYVALVPDLFWSVQPELVRTDIARLADMVPVLLETLRTGLHTIGHPEDGTSAFLGRLVEGYQRALAAQEGPAAFQPAHPPAPQALPGVPPVPADPEAAPAALPTQPASPFVLGAWIELTTSHRKVRTQLTWVSPQHTLFLFTAPDGSTQSMTRRMRDKLAAEGVLRVLPAQREGTRPESARPAKKALSGASVQRKPPPSAGR